MWSESKGPGDYSADETLQENFESLLLKERRLAELTLLEKDRQIKELESKLADSSAANSSESRVVVQPTSVERPTRPVSPPPRRTTVLDDEEALRVARSLPLQAQGVNEESLRRLSRQIAFLPQVTSIDLSHNALGDGCAHPLAALLSSKSKVKHLNLSSNRLGVDAVHAVCRALRRNNTLTSLDLSDNPFGSVPMVGKMLGEMLSESKTLTALRITVAEPRRDRESGGARGSTTKFASSVTQSPSIVDLGMVGATLPRSTVSVLAQSIQAGRLVSLDLTFGFLGIKGAATLARALLPHRRGGEMARARRGHGGGGGACVLRTLILTSNAISNSGCSWIAKALALNDTLTHVDLASNGLTDSALIHLADALREQGERGGNLLTLGLGRNPFGEGEGGEALLDAVERANDSILSFGPVHELQFSIDLRRRLLGSLRSNMRGHERDVRSHMTLLLSRDDHVQLISNHGNDEEDGTRDGRSNTEDSEGVWNGEAGEGHGWVHAAELVMPPGVSSGAGTLLLEWEASIDQHLLAKRRASMSRARANVAVAFSLTRSKHSHTSEIVANGGEDHGHTVRGGPGSKGLAWHKHVVVLPEMAVGESLHLWLTVSGGYPGDKRLVANLRRLRLYGQSSAEATAAGRRDKRSDAEGLTIHVDGRNVIKAFETEVNRVGFVLTHAIYLHAASGSLELSWEARVEHPDGYPLMLSHGGSAVGLEWRVVRAAGNLTLRSGGPKDSLDQSVARGVSVDVKGLFVAEELPSVHDEGGACFARYRVELPQRRINVADTIELWVGVPHEAALRCARRTRDNQSGRCACRVHVRRVRVVMRGGGASAAASLSTRRARGNGALFPYGGAITGHATHTGDSFPLRLDLMGPTPFGATDNTWA